jgi:hypothetical protein
VNASLRTVHIQLDPITPARRCGARSAGNAKLRNDGKRSHAGGEKQTIACNEASSNTLQHLAQCLTS